MATGTTRRANVSGYRSNRDLAYEPGAPIPCPEAFEDDSESAWVLWNKANRGADDWDDADTQPMGLF